MAWIESHQEIGPHPKTRKAARAANTSVPAMVGHLHLIWHWALDFAQEGDITNFDRWQVEDAAMWDGEEGALYEALRLAGFIDVNNDGVCSLHDWYNYAGKLIERRKADAARKRGDSAKNPDNIQRNIDTIRRNSDGTPTEGVGNRKDSNVTVTLTVPEPINDDTLAPDGANDRQGLTSIDGGKAAPTPHERRFNRFWTAYPKKRSKQDAWKSWIRIKPDDDLTDRIIKALASLRRTPDWTKQDGQFIPYPATWLNAGGWEDEIDVQKLEPGQKSPDDWSHRKAVLA